MGTSSCETGVSNFDQIWLIPGSESWLLNIQVYRAANNKGELLFYVSRELTGPWHLALDLTDHSGFISVCKWSPPWSVDLNQLEGFNFSPGEPYYLRVVCGSNAHIIYGLRFCADEAVGTGESSWGEIKMIYR